MQQLRDSTGPGGRETPGVHGRERIETEAFLDHRETEATSQLSAILTASVLATLWVTRRCAWLPSWAQLQPPRQLGSASAAALEAARYGQGLRSSRLQTATGWRRLGLALGELDKLTGGKVHITESQKIGKFE